MELISYQEQIEELWYEFAWFEQSTTWIL